MDDPRSVLESIHFLFIKRRRWNLCGRQAGHAEIPLDDQQAMLRLPFFRLAHCDPEEP